ncbi:Cys-tRNA(Pro) deacylase [Herbiconiux sp. CPCC 203407]|uniref:Cys-tRNA(Pro)/Cys-tRNA(Cys) deacylase n=1 Tax=Herbiconiux oxytropis TaxID=2970915 RepID=A0AA41XK95_9MICO|nr:Cys-tRNA(Pro) deacylase [Herbiconiux oxytropis]MCS5722407.1 Cys-tRNA(Pro) deacylase [Herbiconiux oxytropis]MCS5727196.1 Cys-tRNA(Pro) deacylase [Herbiconiux oxytropis]
MAKKNDTAGPTTAATRALRAAGIRFVPHAYRHDAAATDFGAEAARELGIEPARVFKTLMVETDAGLGIGIVSVRDQLDLKALAGELGSKKAAMADRAVAERKSGYVVGGISPVGQRTRLDTVVDDAATQFPTIFVSGGRRGFDIEIAPADLLTAVGGRIARIRRNSGDD